MAKKKKAEIEKIEFQDDRIGRITGQSEKELNDRIRQYNETRASIPTNAQTFVESQTGDPENQEEE